MAENDAIRSAIELAFSSVAGSAEAQLSALEHCLQQTSAHLPTDGSGWAPTSDEDWWWILRRLQALQHLDRLQTALAICQGTFSGDVFSAIRDADISKVASEFASAPNLLALTTLIERHPYSLFPGCLDLLSRIPETVLAKSFTPVLRLVVSLHSPPAPPREADWVENESMCVALRRRGEQHHVLLCTEHMAKLNLGWAPPSEAGVASWALKRAIAIDASTGQLYSAMELLEIARAALHYGPAGHPLAELHRAAEGLSSLVQLAARRGEEGWQMELGTFSALDSVAKLRLLFKHLDSDDLATDVQRIVVPFAAGLLDQQHQQSNHNYQGGEDQITFISRALEAEAKERLQWVSKFISTEAQSPAALETHANVVRAACAATYASASTEAWALQEALLTSAQEAIVSSSSSSSMREASDGALQAEVLRNTVLQARGHLTAARVLTRYGLPTTMAEVRDADHDTAITIIRTLLARVARARPAESRWGDLWNDLRMAQEEGLYLVPLSEVREEVCRALLGCGQLRPAQKHLDQLDPARQEALVLEAARDVFYSEGAPDAGAVKRAKQVLSALPSSEAAREEASFIDAAARLQALGVDMPPLQLRQAPDKARVLRHALQNAPPKALRDVDGLVALSEALGTELAREQVLAMVADVALLGTQLKLAEGVAMQLASEHSQYGWHVAARLALEEPCSTESIRRTLLAYALRFAPREEMEGQLHCWQASDAGAAGDAAVWGLPEAPADVADLYPRTAEVPLSDFLAGGGSTGRGAPEDNSVLLLSCLLALGPVRQVEWARQLEELKASLSSEALRQGHIVGIVAAAKTALTSESTDDEGQEPRDKSKDISPIDLLSSTPREILLMALDRSISTKTAGTSEELTTLLHSLCQHLVAAADAQSVARLLPGQQGLGGDAASQRATVLQLASAAGRGGVSKGSLRDRYTSLDDDTASEESSPRDSEGVVGSDGGNHISGVQYPAAETSLQHVLALAERYDVASWEVYTAYVVAALRDGASQEHVVQTRLNAAWPLLRKAHPTEAVSALVNRVFPFVENLTRLAMMLRMCAECYRGVGEEGSDQAAAALESVSTAAEALDKNVAGLDMKTLIKPLLYSMIHWMKLESNSCLVTPGEVQAAVQEGVAECHSIQTVALLAQGLDAIATQHTALIAATSSSKKSVKPHVISHPYPCTYPATGSTVYVAAACRELASLALAEGVDAQQRHRLQQCFHGMVAQDIVAVAGFACLGNSPPLLEEAILSDTSVLLSSDQSLAVLEEALAALDNPAIDFGTVGAAIHSQGEGVSSKVDMLRKERIRLATIEQIYATCQLSESQARAVEGVVVEMQGLKPEENGEAGVILLTRQLAELFASGCCVVPGISGVADALIPITPLSDDQLDTPSALARGASTAVDEALQTLAGNTGNGSNDSGLSIGDAIQSLYGVLRSLDVFFQIGNQKGQGGQEEKASAAAAAATTLVKTLRMGVWSQLEHHASTCNPGNNAAAAEAHLQVLQMLGSLGSSMWKGWKPPAGDPTSAIKHAEALLHSRVAATLASAWPGVLQEAAVTVQEFASVEGTEAAILRVISCAQSIDQFQAVLTVLTDVLLDAFPAQEGDSLDSLHHCWSGCFSGLLSHGAIDLMLSAADVLHFRRPPLLPCLSHTEVEALIEAADASGGIAARVALALLTPYQDLRAAGWALLLALPQSDDISGLPGATALAIVALQQELLAELARHSPATLRHLLSSILQTTTPAMCSDLIGGQHSNSSSGMPLRSALAAAAAAQLVEAGEFKAAAWVAMEHSGLHPLLRVLDSAHASLNGLLRAASRASALEHAEIEAESAAAVVAARSGEAVVRGVPVAATQALERCDL